MNERTTNLLIPIVAALLTTMCGHEAARPEAAGAVGSDATAAAAGPSSSEGQAELPETVRLTAAAISEAGIQTWTVKPVDLAHLFVLNGTVGHDENKLLEVAANVRGRAVEIPVDLGARVKKGDVLVTIESIELGRTRQEFIAGLTALRIAARAYERARALVDADAISAGEFQTREGDYLSKKTAAEAAERTLHLLGESDEQIERLRGGAESGTHSPAESATLSLRAPFAGRVIDRNVTPGALFEALQPLITLADRSTVWVFLQAYEKDLAQLREGVSVTIRTDAYPEQIFAGKLDFLGSVIDPATRAARVRATVANGDEKLRPGMFVRAQVNMPQLHSGTGVVAVPESALQTIGGRTVVFVQREPGIFVRRPVEIGHNFEGLTEVLSGVKLGDVVVTEGSFVLKSEFAKASLAERD